MLYNVEIKETLEDRNILQIGFGEPSSNDLIVPEAVQKARAVKEKLMGKLLLITGVASLPVAMALSAEFAHIVPAVACFDPKIEGGSYIVVVTHDPKFKLGEIISQ